MSNRTGRITLTEHIANLGPDITVITRQTASVVPPAYRRKPLEEQVKTGLSGVQEVLLSNDTIVFICIDDEFVFEAPESAGAHRSKAHPSEKTVAKKAAKASHREGQSVPEPEPAADEPKSNKADALRRTQTNDEEPTYSFLKNSLENLRQDYSQCVKDNLEQSREIKTLRGELAERDKTISTLHARIEELDDMLKAYESTLIPDGVRVRFVHMMAEAMEIMGDKWMQAVTVQAQANKAIDEIIVS